MVRIVEKLHPGKDAVMQWHMQAGNITTNLKVNIDFTLPAISATNFVTWKFHVNDCTKGGCDMILGLYLLTELGLNFKLSDHSIESDDGHFKVSTTPMVDLGVYDFKDLNTGKLNLNIFY